MTKDNQQRKKLLDNLLDLLVEEGVSGLTVRKLATRSDVAIGTVQHYFPTKAQMIHAAAHHALSQSAFPLQAANSSISSRQLIDLAHVLVPSDATDRAAHIWLEITALAAKSPEIAQEHAQFWQIIEDGFAKLITSIPELQSYDARELAAQIIALVDGLTLAVISEPHRMSGQRAHACIDQWFKTSLAQSV